MSEPNLDLPPNNDQTAVCPHCGHEDGVTILRDAYVYFRCPKVGAPDFSKYDVYDVSLSDSTSSYECNECLRELTCAEIQKANPDLLL